MTVLTLALLAGSQPAAPRLAPVHQIGPQSRRQSPHTPCAPLVRTDALTLTWQKADRYKRSAPTSSSHTPWPNPHSACGTAAAPLPAISCLGAFRPPAARARGEVRHCRQPKTCTNSDHAATDSIRSPRRRRRADLAALRGRSPSRSCRLMTSSNLLACTTGKSRLRTLEDAAGIDADLPMRICQARSVAHQPAGFDACTRRIYCKDWRRPLKLLLKNHSIISVTRTKNDSGMVKPSAFAVVLLKTRANLSGCSTGMSAGFEPRRILST